MDPRENPGIQPSRLNGLQQFVVRIPPARVLEIPERFFPARRLQRDGGVAGFPKERGNRYRDIWNNFSRPAALFVPNFAHFVTFLGSCLFFLLAKTEGLKECSLHSRNPKKPAP